MMKNISWKTGNPLRLPPRRLASLWLMLLLTALIIVACDAPVQRGNVTTPTPAETPTPDFSALPEAGKVGASIVFPGVSQNYTVVASDTSVWVHDEDAGTVIRIDPATYTIVATIPIRVGIGDIALADGGVWVASSNDGLVWQIDPQTNRVVAKVQLTAPLGPLTVSPGAVWVIGKTHNTLWRIDPTTHKVVATLSTLNTPETPSFAAGALWICNRGDNNRSVVRIDPQTNQITAHITISPTPRYTCQGLAALDNTIWVLVYDRIGSTNFMERVDPATNKASGHYSLPDNLTYGPIANQDGVWSADRDGNIYHMKAQTNQVVSKLNISGFSAMALSGNELWICSTQYSGVMRVKLTS